MKVVYKSSLLFCLAAFLFGCSESGVDSADSSTSGAAEQASVEAAAVETETQSVPAAEAPASTCEDESNISFLCGPTNAEDIVRLGDSVWLLASGMDGSLTGADISGSIHLVNHETKEYEILFPGDNPVFEQDQEMFAACPGPINPDNFSAHGLGLKRRGDTDQYRLYMTSHGEREAIEVFDIDATAKPTIQWVGCVPTPPNVWANSVAVLNDGGFIMTQFMEIDGGGIGPVVAGEITGRVYEWHPGGEIEAIPGTDLSGANGIVLSEDENTMYVAAFGGQQLLKFDRGADPIGKVAVDLGIRPDNVRWTDRGTLYTAGGNAGPDCSAPECGLGWSVYEIDPNTLAANRLAGVGHDSVMQGASTALLVDDEIWIGAYAGDRLGILPKP